MCKCENVQMVALSCCVSIWIIASDAEIAQLYKGDNLHICTFSHLHIN